jgi:thiamine pyrophosphokinase
MAKTVIFANGIPTARSNEYSLIEPDDTIICADGGTQHALSLGLTPDVLVGDMDSLPEAVQADLEAKGVELIRHPIKKDQTDLELAFEVAIARGATEILLLTAIGGRLDQQLANVLLLTRPEWQSVRLSLAEGQQRAWLLRGPDELTLSGQPGDTLSIVPLSATMEGLDIENAEWPLQEASVPLGSTLTISNTFLSNQVRVRVKAGLGLIIQIGNVKREA